MSPSSENIDYQPTMNVAKAHAAAREHADATVQEAPLTNLPLVLSAIVLLIAGSFIGANLSEQKGQRPQGGAQSGPPMDPKEKWLKDGATVFSNNCASCHQLTGLGNPGSGFPPLAGSEWVTGGEKRLATIVLKGLQGPITVKGTTFGSAVMNAKGGNPLTEKQVAQALSHIRNSWGNTGSLIMDDQIKEYAASIAALPSPIPFADVEKIPASENLPPTKKPFEAAAPAGAPGAPAQAQPAAAGTPPPTTNEAVKIKLGVIPGTMKYDKTEFEANVGQKVEITLTNEKDPLQHNLSILKPGSKDRFTAEINKAMVEPSYLSKNCFIDSPDVLARGTKLVGIGQSDKVEFTPPGVGDYPIVCTFPGHIALMSAMLRVK